MYLLRRLAIIFLLILTLGACVSAAEVNLKWVEVDVSPRKDGKASIVYKIRYHIINGEMHGFYLGGFGGAEPHFDYDKSYAFDASGHKYGLSISPYDDRYDVVLANGESVSSGDVTYIVLYGTDMAGAGILGYTQSQFGKLAYFDWAPSQWKKPMEHMTVYLHYPIQVSGKTVSKATLKKVGFRTEKYVNQNYLISYYGQPYNGKYYLTVRFHKKNPESQYHMRIQCYTNAKYFAFKKEAASTVPKGESKSPSTSDQPSSEPYGSPDNEPISVPLIPPSSRAMGGLVILVAMVGIALMLLKKKIGAYSNVINRLDEVSWDKGDWVPPRVQVSTFRQQGKVAELDPVEAAYLLEIPLAKILGAIIANMEREGLVKVLSLDPLKLERLYPPGVAPANMYEDILINSIRGEGVLDDQEVKSLFKEMTDKVQAKAWDCDLEATKNYYREQIKEQFLRVQRGEDISGSYDSWGHSYPMYYAYYFYNDYVGRSQGRPNEISSAVQDKVVTAGEDYGTFMHSEACHDACYVHTACHDACHDACHSACHDACHSACHDACHSACVSGDEH